VKEERTRRCKVESGRGQEVRTRRSQRKEKERRRSTKTGNS